jgi:hypothetical protein
VILSDNHQKEDLKVNNDRCDSCMAEDEKKHPLLNFIVKVEAHSIDGSESKLCQRCLVKAKVRSNRTKVNNKPSSYSLREFYRVFLGN